MNIKDMDKLKIGDIAQEGDYFCNEGKGEPSIACCTGQIVQGCLVNDYYRPRKAKESTGMSNQDKIAVIEAAAKHFNFQFYEYRIKPKVTSGQRIRNLVREHDLHPFEAQALASLFRTNTLGESDTKERKWLLIRSDRSRGDEIAYHSKANGDVQFGCQFFKWEEIDAYAKEEGWWK